MTSCKLEPTLLCFAKIYAKVQSEFLYSCKKLRNKFASSSIYVWHCTIRGAFISPKIFEIKKLQKIHILGQRLHLNLFWKKMV